MFQNLRAQELLKGSSYAEYNKPKSIAADVFNDIEKRSGKTIKRTKYNEVPNINASSSDIINTLFDFWWVKMNLKEILPSSRLLM